MNEALYYVFLRDLSFQLVKVDKNKEAHNALKLGSGQSMPHPPLRKSTRFNNL